MHRATQDAVRAIASISKTIGETDQIANAIAAAVEEQGAATQEMARNVEGAAKVTQEVSSNIGGVTEAANGTAAAVQVLTAARALAGQSGHLKDVGIGTFRPSKNRGGLAGCAVAAKSHGPQPT